MTRRTDLAAETGIDLKFSTRQPPIPDFGWWDHRKTNLKISGGAVAQRCRTGSIGNFPSSPTRIAACPGRWPGRWKLCARPYVLEFPLISTCKFEDQGLGILREFS